MIPARPGSAALDFSLTESQPQISSSRFGFVPPVPKGQKRRVGFCLLEDRGRSKASWILPIPGVFLGGEIVFSPGLGLFWELGERAFFVLCFFFCPAALPIRGNL